MAVVLGCIAVLDIYILIICLKTKQTTTTKKTTDSEPGLYGLMVFDTNFVCR